MSASILGLPPVPPELKPITPYIQRAEELKSQDPIVSYWCAYYAAQVGISLKAHSSAARDLLFALLNALEHMKAAIGANDAIDIESVSSAYIENFALKVFANADNEDRSGRASRSTAKKFLAAANFLEVLKTFSKSDVSESNEEKIRYAKWKAADIAKAFREGRKPVPGPPGWAEEQEEMKRLEQEEKHTHTSSSRPYPESSSRHSNSPPHTTNISPPRTSHASSSSPPKHSPISHSPTQIGHQVGLSITNDVPEAWSTTSTPGIEASSNVYTIGTPTPSTAGYDRESIPPAASGISQAKQRWDATEGSHTKKRSGSGSSYNSTGTNGNRPWASEELGGKQTRLSTPPKSSFKSGSPDSDKKVHFSPSTIGAPPNPPHTSSGSPKEYLGPSSIYAPPKTAPVDIYQSHSTTRPSVPSPPSLPPASPSRPYGYAASPPSQLQTQASPPRVGNRNPYSTVPNPTPPPLPAAFELTPAVIAKAQKHCRFAISSLDYEDADEARKQLREALALLGG
ncbi:Vacuolar protein sorting-associated protein VTA1-like protein [Psilocybe cubensis]|uniref:DUF605-domain-containing protein n=2 Tax=Psilocybe cubensis TaxID=181762 RepID=A0A8H8CQD3_PSICU|nr:Vacuolar protein sorting-associated protein VTA1-like protein [Psilocybe cubensis]KAH9486495.1 Vacuolar protein sorting-associated protein VTA1-like protein [Psilocybe cubensis]